MPLKPFPLFDLVGGSWVVAIAGCYPVYVVFGDGNVIGVASDAQGFDRIISGCFDVLARMRLRNGGRIPKDCARWMRSRPPMVSVVRIDGRKRRPHAIRQYVVALAVDRKLRVVPREGG